MDLQTGHGGMQEYILRKRIQRPTFALFCKSVLEVPLKLSLKSLLSLANVFIL